MANKSTFDIALEKIQKEKTENAAPQIAKLYDAYKSGKMTPDEKSQFEDDVRSGLVMLPRGASIEQAKQEPQLLPVALTYAYLGGKLTPEEKAQLESDVKSGLVRLSPTRESQIPTGPGFVAPTEQPLIEAPAPEPSLGERLLGAGELGIRALAGPAAGSLGPMTEQARQMQAGLGEAGATALTGATTGTLASMGATGKGIAQSILDGTFGTEEAQRLVEQQAFQAAGAGTYIPRTPVGQSYAERLGQLSESMAPIAPLTGEMAAIGAATRAGVQAGAPLAAAAAQRAIAPISSVAGRAAAGVQAGAERFRQGIARAPEVIAPVTEEQPRTTVRPLGPAPSDIINDASVRARPSDVTIDAASIGKRDTVLDAIGIPADQRRLGAQTGNKSQIQNEVMIGKLEGADRMKQQFSMEAQKLGDYAAAIQRDAGGTPGANPLQRGEAISAPLEGYQQWYKQQINGLYKLADEEASKSGVPITLGNLESTLNTASEFAGKSENSAIRRGLRAYLKEQGALDNEGKMMPVNAEAAERIKQYLNSQWSPQTKGLIGKLKGQIDDDVLSVLPKDIYGQARSMRRQYAEIFEDPKGLSQILDISGPEGINRAISLDKLPDTLSNWASKNTAQFRHVMGTLENLPTPELQQAGQQAINEVRSHIIEKILEKNIDSGEVALGRQAEWRGTDESLKRAMEPYRGKLNDLLGKDLADRMETLKVGARILRPFDPNPSGTATTALNLQSELSKKAIMGAGGAAGAAIGGMTGGPMGATGGAVTGAALAKRVVNMRQQRAIDRAISRSLDAVEKTKHIQSLAKEKKK